MVPVAPLIVSVSETSLSSLAVTKLAARGEFSLRRVPSLAVTKVSAIGEFSTMVSPSMLPRSSAGPSPEVAVTWICGAPYSCDGASGTSLGAVV